MKLLILTCAPFSSRAGHLSRLSLVLEDLSKLNDISIVCLGKDPDDEYKKRKYKDISFFHSPVKFDGWRVSNLKETVKNIDGFVKRLHPDLVVLQMEIWDLMRELGKNLAGRAAFATVVHAMPFLVSPVYPSGDFEADVIKYSTSGIEEYRKDYIINHYQETENVFRNVSIIANNKTVAFYLKEYFKDMKVWTMASLIPSEIKKHRIIATSPMYDFAYMARMEAGKGVEYLSEILERISVLLNRQVKVAILGRADDALSKNALNELISTPGNNERFTVEYFGWADNDLKKQVLTISGVFLYPSHYDNYPTVLNEALAFGLPSIIWDVPYARLNYSDTKAVKRTPLFDFQQFAENAVSALNSRNKLSKYALKFANTLNSPATIARLDTNMFEQIRNQTG